MNSELEDIIADLQTITENARNTFGGFSAEQVNWKPSSDKWSVGQCFEHLIKINSPYFPIIDAIVKGERKQTFLESYSPLSGFFGRMLFKSMSPESERKLKAPTPARPSASDVSAAIIEEFAGHQSELIEKIRSTEEIDTKKTIITSPFAGMVTYSLFDAFRILATHEKRHFGQAERVVAETGFPK